MINAEDILGKDGSAFYFPFFLPAEEALRFEQELYHQLHWQSDRVKIFGRDIETKRRMAWYADEAFDYRYSGKSHFAEAWPPILQRIRDLIARNSNYYFNSCLANKYENGNESMGWHSDDEACMDPEFPIASLSFGAERRFVFRHRLSKEKKELMLSSGSLLLMMPPTQQEWQHCLPRMASVKTARINLTFRHFLSSRPTAAKP